MNKGIIKRIYRVSDIEKIDKKIKMLGSNQKITFDAVSFLNIRMITTILLSVLLIAFSHLKYYIIPFIIIFYYNMFHYILITVPLNRRTKKLDREALTFFEILGLTLETGKNLENALEITCKNVDGELSDEFKKSLMEMRFGKSFMESLENLKMRIPSSTINGIILNIMQTDIFGNSIIATINNQVDYLREKQFMEVRGEINKIPNKVSIISVIFIVPLILLIILGPFIMSLI